jgi:hypothetical protein
MIYDPAKYAVGTTVRIKPRATLETYQRPQWKYHHPLDAEQIQYAERTAQVASSGMYHGGDVLYQLSGIPGIWHEACLDAAGSAHAV